MCPLRFKKYLLLAALMSTYPLLGYTASAARVEFVVGNVSASGANGAKRSLERGSELNAGETVDTGDGRAQLRFADGGMMSLQPQTEFRIDEYKYDGKIDGQERSFFSLLRGGLRTISGLIGHGNHDNYRVTTSVATIGIRGTEWSGTLEGTGENAQLILSTGEGAIEVCNAGGCLAVASGESAIVTGNSKPERTEVHPSLPAASIITPPPSLPVYSQAEDRTADGSLAILGPKELTTGPGGLTTGPGYAVFANMGSFGGSPSYLYNTSTTATFDPGSKLVNFSDGSGNSTSAGAVVSASSIDGVIGWGYWVDGTSSYAGGTPIGDLHYVVGKPTSADDLNNLAGMSATYQIVGFTAPTTTLGGAAGSNVTGNLQASFNPGSVSVNVSLNMSMQGQSLSVTASGGSESGAFYLAGSGTGGITTEMQGAFFGPNASHAGLTYSINATAVSLGQIAGAVAYKQNSIAPTAGPP